MFISLFPTNLEKNDINICKCFSLKLEKDVKNNFSDEIALTYTVQPLQASHFEQETVNLHEVIKPSVMGVFPCQ